MPSKTVPSTADCVLRTRQVLVSDSSRSCSAVGRKVCDSPCYDCPLACRKTNRTVCTLRHRVLTNISLEQGVLRQQETLGKTISCEEEEEEKLCAPINCHYVNISSACTERQEGPASALQLTTRTCPLCQDLPGPGTAWTKHCALTRQELQQFFAPGELGELGELPRSLLASTDSKQKFQPDTPTDTNSQESVQTTTKSPLESLKEDLLLIIQKEDKLMQENIRMMTNLNLKPENVNVNIKYNIVTNSEKHGEKNSTKTSDPILDLIDNVIKVPTKQNRTIIEGERSSAGSVGPSSTLHLPLITTDLASRENKALSFHKTTVGTRLGTKVRNNTVRSTTVGTTVRSTTVGTTVRTTTGGTTVRSTTVGTTERSTTIGTTERSTTVGTTVSSTTVGITVRSTTIGTTVRSTTVRTKVRTTTVGTTERSTTIGTTVRTLSAAQLIRLCFTTGRGCDFSQDFSSRTTPSTSRPTPSTTPTPPPRTAAKAREDQNEMLRQRLKLCFFSRICEIDDSQSKVRQPRVITAAVAVAAAKSEAEARREKMKKIIREKARACFFHGKC